MPAKPLRKAAGTTRNVNVKRTTRTRKLPAGQILSSTHLPRAERQKMRTKPFTKKHLLTTPQMERELTQHRYPRQRFPNLVVTMLYPGNNLPEDVSVFKVPMRMSKPMIKNYFEELYNVKVLKVNTAIAVGKLKMTGWGTYQLTSDYKKAYVRTAEIFKFPLPRPLTFPPTLDRKLEDFKNLQEEKKKKEEAKARKNASI